MKSTTMYTVNLFLFVLLAVEGYTAEYPAVVNGMHDDVDYHYLTEVDPYSIAVPSRPVQTNSLIDEMITRVNPDSADKTLRELVAFHNRDAKQSYNRDELVPYLKMKLLEYGCDSVFETILQSDSVAPEVTGVRFGKKNATLDTFCIIAGSCDNYIPGQQDQRHQGAWDNASGVVCWLEAARVFSHYEFEYTIVFSSFNASEYGLIGSKQILLNFKEAGFKNISGFTYTMTGWGGTMRMSTGSAAGSSELVQRSQELYESYNISQYITLNHSTEFRDRVSDRSLDLGSFNQNGFLAVGFMGSAPGCMIHTSSDVINDQYDSLNLAYTSLIGIVVTADYAVPHKPDCNCFVLIELYNSTDGPNWTDNTNWLSRNTIDTWKGVNGTAHTVTRIDLHENALSGTIPTSIGKLNNLTSLLLHSNQLTGTIPAQIGSADDLTILRLDNNQLTGPIPQEIGSLINLTTLSLSTNLLTGNIPPEIGELTALTELWLDSNQLTGSVPSEINNIRGLKGLLLNDNDLEALPDLSRNRNIANLQIQNNKFTFEDIEPNINVSSNIFIYSPQDSVGTEKDTTVIAGEELLLSVSVGGSANLYQWMRNGEIISGADRDTLIIASVNFADTGAYICRINNTIAPQLTLYSRPVTVRNLLTPESPSLVSPVHEALNVVTNPTLIWNVSGGADSYNLQVSTVADFTTSVIDQGAILGSSYATNTLKNNTKYYWHVSATNEVGNSAWSTSWNFSTIVAAPASPALVSPANGTMGVDIDPVVIWNASPGATTYDIQVSTTPDFLTLVVDESSITVTSFGLSGLTNNTPFYWQVRATNIGGTSDWSSAWNFSTIVAAPASPALVSPANGAMGVNIDPVVTWNASPGATTYDIQVSTTPDFLTLVVDESSITVTSFGLSGLTNSTPFYWQVRATNIGGTSDWSSVWNFTTIAAAPASPALVSPANGAMGVNMDPVVTWNASAGATSYTVQVSRTSDFASFVVNNDSIKVTSWTVPGLIKDTQYFWRVSATNAGGTSPWSDVWNFTIIPTTVLETTIVSNQESITFTIHPSIVNNECQAVKFYSISNDRKNAAMLIYDALGNTVFTGEYELPPSQSQFLFGSWNLRNPLGKRVSNGTYLAVLKSTDQFNTIEVLKATFGVKEH